jgi:hypothetical protein
MGRKKMKTEDKIDIRMRVSEELRQRISEAASEDESTVAAFIRSAVVKELRRRDQEGAK